MRKFSAFFVILATTALCSLTVSAQDGGHTHDGADDTPAAIVTPEVPDKADKAPAEKALGEKALEEKAPDAKAEGKEPEDKAAEKTSSDASEAEGQSKAEEKPVVAAAYESPVVTTPGHAWRVIEESVRNISDAMKGEHLDLLPRYTEDMSNAMAYLLAAKIHTDLKPDEKEHLYNSLQNLNQSVDELVTAVATDDKEKITEATNQIGGVVTLTRIDVPPGLLERVSGAQVRAEIVNTPVLKKGEEATVTLRLKSAVSGKPLTPTDLKNVHTRVVHALVIEPQLTDYTHAHPEDIDVPGEYTFKITPQTNCTYRLWADVTPVKGTQEFAVVDLPGVEGCGTVAIDKVVQSEAAVSGYKVTLKADGDVTTGRNVTLTFDVTDGAGTAVTTLEPIMGAYAHVVGFYDDYRTIAHLHPMGAAPKEDSDRGSSPLTFHFKPERAGFVRLYMQVSISGQEIMFPFGLNIQ